MTEGDNKKYLVGAGIALGLGLLKLYFSGARCPVSRDMTHEVAVVTGGNVGIGKQTVYMLAKKGCTVIMGSRDRVKSEQVVTEIREATRNQNVFYVPLDLSSKLSIHRFAEFIIERYARVDILINNAAILGLQQRTLNDQGHEMHFAVNHLGHFYLTSLLWTLLKRSARLRIINVSALAHKMNIQRNHPMILNFDSLDGSYPVPGRKFGQYDWWYAYSASKLANVLFTLELARRVESLNPDARVVSLHPGIVRTEIGRNLLTGWKKVVKWLVTPLTWLFFKSANQGAQTTIYCAMQSSDRLKNGGYYSDCRLDEIAGFAKIPDHPRTLWDISQKMLGITFPAD